MSKYFFGFPKKQKKRTILILLFWVVPSSGASSLILGLEYITPKEYYIVRTASHKPVTPYARIHRLLVMEHKV